MPRVHNRKKSPRPTKRPYICTGCGKEIEPGQRYYTWARRYGGPRYRHTECGYPRPTELSDRKTAIIEEAVQDASEQFASWNPADELTDDYEDETFEINTDDLVSILESVADEADNVAEEYTSGADNMPDALYYSPTAEAMREVGQELESWSSDIRYWTPASETTIDLPARTDYDDPQDWHEAATAKISEAADEIRSDAESKLEGMPEYSG